MSSPALQLIALAVRHLDDIADLKVRADLLEEAAWFADHRAPERGQHLRRAAAEIRRADDAQLLLEELLSPELPSHPGT